MSSNTKITPASDFSYQLTEAGTARIVGYSGDAQTVVCPDEIDGHTVTEIGVSAFFSCSSLTSVTLPAGVTTIGDWAFIKCRSLTSVTIPNGVTTIGGGAFSYCSSLTHIYVDENNTHYSSKDGLLMNKAGDTLIRCPAGRRGAVKIPAGVTTIGRSAFCVCDSLTSVTIPNGVTTIEDGAFGNCSSLASVTIPNGVITIGDDAFRNCSSLTSVTIPNGVTTIGDYAFRNCSSLTSVTIPNSVTMIGRWAFYNCSSLTHIHVDENNAHYSSKDGLLMYKAGDTLIRCPAGRRGAVKIPAGVTTIGGDWAFCNCSSLTSVTIPNGVTTIGDYAFSDCSSLTSVTIPNSVTTIGDYAFRNCRSLTSVTIPNGVTTIKSWAFSGCDSLTSVTLPASVVTMDRDIFAGCPKLTLGVHPGSRAEEYAKCQPIPYRSSERKEQESSPPKAEKEGQPINIHSKGAYPSNMLSNFAPHPFELDGVTCGSMEGFLQSLKYKNVKKQRRVCALVGKEAKKAGSRKRLWKLTHNLWWQGRKIKRTSADFDALIDRAYDALSRNPTFAKALLDSGTAPLTHRIGGHDPRKTVLTEEEFVTRLTKLRETLGTEARETAAE